MIDKDFKIHLYIKTTIFFVGLFAFIPMFFIARNNSVLLVFTLITAVVLYPVMYFFVRPHFYRVTAISAWPSLYLLVTCYIIQLIDNNHIVPEPVSSKVKINALFSSIILIAGNALWGVTGCFPPYPNLPL